MRIRLKTLYASPAKVYQIDEIGDFSDSEGKALIDGKFGISLEPIKVDEIKPVVVETVIEKGNIAPIKKEVRPKNIKKKGKK